MIVADFFDAYDGHVLIMNTRCDVLWDTKVDPGIPPDIVMHRVQSVSFITEDDSDYALIVVA